MPARAVAKRRSITPAVVPGYRRTLSHKQRAAYVIGPKPPLPIWQRFAGATNTQAMKLVADTVNAPRPFAERAVDTHELVSWAAASGSAAQRRTMVKAFKQSNSAVLLVHHIGTLPKAQMESFVSDYFAAEGDLKSIVQWLRGVGAAWQRPRPIRAKARSRRKVRASKAGTRNWMGDFGEWLRDRAEDLRDSIGNLVDAVITAGKTLAQVIGEVESWAIGELRELARALIQAGKKVGDLLAAAVRINVELLKKFVEAIASVGGHLYALVLWSATQPLNWAIAVVGKLLKLQTKLMDILTPVLTDLVGCSAIVKALLGAGIVLGRLVATVVDQSQGYVEFLARAMLMSGQTIRSLLVEAANLTANACNAFVQGMLRIGHSVAQLIFSIATSSPTSLRSIVGALLRIGFVVGDILKAAATLASGPVSATIGALLKMNKTLSQLTSAALACTAPVVRATFNGFIAQGYKLQDILGALAGRTVSALHMGLDALLTIGMTLRNLVTEVVTSVAEHFRRGFFEGLIALGTTPLQIVKTASEVSSEAALAAFTAVIELFGGHRALSKQERAEAEKVFGSSINLNRVKIAVASLPADIINYINDEPPFSTMRIINFASRAEVDMPTLIHELAHVWQGVQTGPLYMVKAFESQIAAGVNSLFHTGHYDDEDAYAVTKEALRANQGDFSKFNPEQQANIVEYYWVQKFSGAPTSQLPAVKLLDAYARQVFKPLGTIPMKSRTKFGHGSARRLGPARLKTA